VQSKQRQQKHTAQHTAHSTQHTQKCQIQPLHLPQRVQVRAQTRTRQRPAHTNAPSVTKPSPDLNIKRGTSVHTLERNRISVTIPAVSNVSLDRMNLLDIPVSIQTHYQRPIRQHMHMHRHKLKHKHRHIVPTIQNQPQT
jgi:hypothetical protein